MEIKKAFRLLCVEYISKMSISVTRHDGVTVMANERLRVCFKVFTDIQAFRNQWYEITGNSWQMTEDDVYEAGLKLTSIKLKDFCQEYRTDVDGKVHFSVNLDNIPANASKLSIQTAALDNLEHGVEQPTDKLDVRLATTFSEKYVAHYPQN